MLQVNILLMLLVPAIPLTSYAIDRNSGIEVTIKNSVKKCIEIEPIATHLYSNLLMLKTEWDLIKSTGYCGCKSALLSYRSLASESYTSEVTYGVFSSIKHNQFNFVLNADSSSRVTKKYILNIGCKTPD